MVRSVVAIGIAVALASCSKSGRKATPRIPTGEAERTACGVDLDCVAMPSGICCSGCGSAPAFEAVNRTTGDAISAANAEACEKQRKKQGCPDYNCSEPPPCRYQTHAVCVNGLCAMRVAHNDKCGVGACPAECGAQPAGAERGARCRPYFADQWAACCCRALGGVQCDETARQSEYLAAECAGNPT